MWKDGQEIYRDVRKLPQGFSSETRVTYLEGTTGEQAGMFMFTETFSTADNLSIVFHIPCIGMKQICDAIYAPMVGKVSKDTLRFSHNRSQLILELKDRYETLKILADNPDRVISDACILGKMPEPQGHFDESLTDVLKTLCHLAILEIEDRFEIPAEHGETK